MSKALPLPLAIAGAPLRLLIIENDPRDAELCLRRLQKAGLEATADVIETREEFIARIRAKPYDLILADYRLPGWVGTDTIAILRELALEIPVVLVTGTLGEEAAVESLKLGAADFVLKDRPARLTLAVRRALDERAKHAERRQREEELRESEARYRSLVENAPYGVFRATIEGKLTDVNPGLVAMLGYGSRDELLAVQSIQELFQEPEKRVRLVEQVQQTGRAEGEFEWKRKNGPPITVRLNGRIVQDDGRGIDCLEMFVEDVTERRTLEKQLQQSQMIKAIGQLAGGIAHDFNNMVGAIMGWAELGLEETTPENRLHSHFQKIQLQAERAALTRQLLAFARRQILAPRNMDLNQAVSEEMNLLEKMIGSDIEVKTVLARNLGNVHCDPTQLEQVLMNLCLNSRDAMPRGGRLLIETQNVEFDEEYCRRQAYAHPGRFVELAVSDNGIGMDAATLDRMFEPFFTTKEVGKGTGLGLATVYGVVKQHGGFVNVYSELGRGTTFRLYFPVSQVAAEIPAKGEPEQPISGGAETILVAEDHEGLLEMARESLSRLGYDVWVASDGEAAVRIFKEDRDRIALVLLDMVMPKMNGPEVYERLCALKSNVRVLFATGYSAEAMKLEALKQDGILVLQKPYTQHTLARMVRKALDRRQQEHDTALGEPLPAGGSPRVV